MERRSHDGVRPTDSVPYKHALAWLAAIALVVAVLYGRSVRFPFIGFDDTRLIVDNQAFLADPGNLPQIFRQHAWTSPTADGAGAYYRPLLILSFMWDAQWGGARPAVYHLTNLTLHTTAAFLACLLFARLGAGRGVALFLGLVLAVHPALVQVVAWVPGRNESLLAVSAIGAMLALDHYARRRDGRWLAAHLALALAALGTKEHAVALAVGVPCFLWLVRGERLREHGRLWVGWAVVLLVWGVARHLALDAPLPRSALELAANAWGNAPVPIHYAGKTFVPVALSVMPTLADVPSWPGLLALALLAAALGLSRRDGRRVVIFGLAWFLAFVGPTLLVPVLVGQEPRLYVPMIGLLASVAWAAASLARRWPRGVGIAGMGALLALASATWMRVPDFSGRERFWESAVEDSPHSSLALMNLGSVRLGEGRLTEAESLSRRAIQENPTEPKAHNNLAVALAQQGRNAEAEEHFRNEIRVNPGYADAYFNYGTFLATTGRPDGAVESWRQALVLAPTHTRALAALARHHLGRGERRLAQPYLDRLDAARPNPTLNR